MNNYALPVAPHAPGRYMPLGQVSDGAIVRLGHPTRLGLKESDAPPGYSHVFLADGSHAELPNETSVAVLRDPIALALVSRPCAAPPGSRAGRR